MKKRIPILFLSAIMMLTLLPAPALAASGDFIIREGELRFYTGNDEFVVIPSNVTSIGNGGVFRGKKLTGVTIPDGVISIGSTAKASLRLGRVYFLTAKCSVPSPSRQT